MAASTLLFVRASPLNRSLLLRHLLRHLLLAAGTDVSLPHHRYCCNAAMEAGFAKLSLPSSSVGAEGVTSATEKLLEVMEPRKDHRLDDTANRMWKDKEEEILRDVEPILLSPRRFSIRRNENYIWMLDQG